MRGTTGQAIAACLAGLAAIVLAVSWPSSAQTEDRLRAHIRQEQAAYLATLKDLVAIESGSRDTEGLDRAASFVAARLRAIGGEVEIVPAPADMTRLEDTPAQPGKTVVARFRGTGSGRDTAVRTLQNMGMEVTWIRDVTPIPHNGCRPKKRRRG